MIILRRYESVTTDSIPYDKTFHHVFYITIIIGLFHRLFNNKVKIYHFDNNSKYSNIYLRYFYANKIHMC